MTGKPGCGERSVGKRGKQTDGTYKTSSIFVFGSGVVAGVVGTASVILWVQSQLYVHRDKINEHLNAQNQEAVDSHELAELKQRANRSEQEWLARQPERIRHILGRGQILGSGERPIDSVRLYIKTADEPGASNNNHKQLIINNFPHELDPHKGSMFDQGGSGFTKWIPINLTLDDLRTASIVIGLDASGVSESWAFDELRMEVNFSDSDEAERYRTWPKLVWLSAEKDRRRIAYALQ